MYSCVTTCTCYWLELCAVCHLHEHTNILLNPTHEYTYFIEKYTQKYTKNVKKDTQQYTKNVKKDTQQYTKNVKKDTQFRGTSVLTPKVWDPPPPRAQCTRPPVKMTARKLSICDS